MLRLDFLDSRRDGLLDLYTPGLDPFQQCRTFLSKMVAGGFRPGKPLEIVYLHFRNIPIRGDLDAGSQNDHLLLNMARGMGLEMCSQVKWRFMPLFNLPFTMGECVHMGLSSNLRILALGPVNLPSLGGPQAPGPRYSLPSSTAPPPSFTSHCPGPLRVNTSLPCSWPG